MIDFRLGDCMEAFVSIENSKFDLAIVDPPYGIFTRDATGFKAVKSEKLENDIAPGKDYFENLLRVSKDQIIFGGNYFGEFLGATRAPIIWDKQTGDNYFADGEMAWTSFETGTLRIFRHQWCGAFKDSERGSPRIHPTQKPVALYTWILMNYAKPGQLILDTHAGSGALAIACHRLGFDYLGFEIEPKYYAAARKRIDEEMSQIRMF